MSLVTDIVKGIGIVSLAGLSLVGCPKNDPAVYQGEPIPEEPTPMAYFAEVPMVVDSGMAMTNGDFDNDGDLDFIVGARWHGGRLYFYENDGTGNFRLKPVENPLPGNYID